MSHPEVLVVGAGPHGLTAACYLLAADPGLAGRLVVVDPAPWLTAWNRRFAALELTSLRSACVHHPHPEPYALLDWAAAAGRRDRFRGSIGSPDAGLFADFCRSLASGCAAGATLLRGTVSGVHPRDEGGVDVALTTGERLRPRAVVLAGAARCRTPRLPVGCTAAASSSSTCAPAGASWSSAAG